MSVAQREPSTREIDAQARETIAKAIQRKVPGLAELTAEISRETGSTPKEVIFTRGTLKLYHYLPQTDDLYRIPVLIVMSLISKPYILDLAPGQSFIEYLVQQGFDVYMVDWGIPRDEHKHLRFDDYVTDFIPQCVEKMQAHSGEHDINMIGYCIGGMLAVTYAALYARGPLRNLALFATPINSDGMALHKKLIESEGFDVDLLVDKLGNVPPEVVSASMQILRPLQKAAGQMTLLNNLDDAAFVKAHLRLAKWGADQIPFPGATFRQMAHDFIRDNKIVKGEFALGGRKVKLSKVKVPFLHVVAEHDHIVPYASSKDLGKKVGSPDKREWLIKGGHVSLVAGRNAVTRMWPQVAAWLAERST
ncbi:MAG TPA: alpha/beta fold hydrolase [Caldimonas sp.]